MPNTKKNQGNGSSKKGEDEKSKSSKSGGAKGRSSQKSGETSTNRESNK